MGPNEQNQYFAELRQKMCYKYIHVVVLLTCCQVWMENLNVLSQKSGKSDCQTRVRPGSSRQGVGTVHASSNFAASHHYES